MDTKDFNLSMKIEVNCLPWQTPNFIVMKGEIGSVKIKEAPYDLVKGMIKKFEEDVWNKWHEAVAEPEVKGE